MDEFIPASKQLGVGVYASSIERSSDQNCLKFCRSAVEEDANAEIRHAREERV